MARSTQVGGLRSVAQREEISPGGGTNLAPPIRELGFKHQFQSSKRSLMLTLKERVVHWKPDGTKEDEIPRTKNGTRCDMVHFTEHHFGTNDTELANMIKALPREVYGVGALVWATTDMKRAQDRAAADQIRTMIRDNPALKKALEPGTGDDWQEEAPAPPAPPPEMTDEELDMATRPDEFKE